MVVAVIVLIGLNMRHVKRIFRSLPQDLLSVRRRSNAFDEHTANETRVSLLQLLQLWVYEGLLLFMWLRDVNGNTVSGGGSPPVWRCLWRSHARSISFSSEPA